MAKLRVHSLAMSLDGFSAGPNQDVDNPMGIGGPRLHEWVFATRAGREMFGAGDGGSTGVDDAFIRAGFSGIGATIMGRNMFGPVRGDWKNEDWRGWWGDVPPFHHDVFVLTHHPRESFAMEGGTTFHFVTDGIDAALARAFDAAAGADVRLGGGAATIQEYLRAGLVDEMHVVIVPIVLGQGERLFDRLDEGLPRYECAELTSSDAVTHVRLVRAT
jgi:dihydrofolate reductase